MQHSSDRVRELLARRDWRGLREFLCSFPPPDIAELISELPEEEMVIAFRLLPRELAAEVLAELDVEKEEALLQRLRDRKLLEVLLELPRTSAPTSWRSSPGGSPRSSSTSSPPPRGGRPWSSWGTPRTPSGG